MSHHTPFSIQIFVADGDPDGLRIIERSNWSGQAVIFPRSLLPEVKQRDEFSQTGVYLLLGPDSSGEGERLYIGEGDPVLPRLESHYREKDFWNRAIFFSALRGHLNKAHIQYLEHRLVALASTARRLPLENGNKPGMPTLHEADKANMEVFLSHILEILPLLGVTAFEQADASTNTAPDTEDNNLLLLRHKGMLATGRETTREFVVHKRAQISSKETPSLGNGIHNQRQKLIDNGIINCSTTPWTLNQDYGFSSASTAASVIMGRQANGRTEWQNQHGTTLKAMQEAQITKKDNSL